MGVFFDDWSDKDDIVCSFGWESAKDRARITSDLEGAEVLFAAYDCGSYEGDAIVVYRRDGNIFEVHASHCSCYGLEDQWCPEEASIKELKQRPSLDDYRFDSETREAFDNMRKGL